MRNKRTFILLVTGFVLTSVSISQAHGKRSPAAAEKKHGEHHGKHHKKHHGMRHDFSDAAHWAAKFNDPARDYWQKPMELIKLMQIAPKMNVADVGAGTGYFMPYLSRAVGAQGVATFVEVEKNLVTFMQKKAEEEKWQNAQVVLTGYDSTGLAPTSQDRILIVNTWHHIDSRPAYAKHLRTVLKNHGELFIVDFEPGKGGPGPGDKHRMPAQKVMQELQAGGFAAEILTEQMPHQYVVRAYAKK